jgi:hypothetical protein
MTVDLNALLTLLLLLCGLIGAFVAAFLRIKKWVADVAKSSKATAAQLETSDDLTIADHVQNTTATLANIDREITDLHSKAATNRETATAALTLANAVGRRLDEHLIRDHGAPAPQPEEN